MAPAWSPRGERLIAGVPHGHWKTTNFLAALVTTARFAPREWHCKW